MTYLNTMDEARDTLIYHEQTEMKANVKVRGGGWIYGVVSDVTPETFRLDGDLYDIEDAEQILY